MKYSNIREEALKNKVTQDFFGKFDCTDIIKEIDFAVKLAAPVPTKEGNYLLWAEAKKGRYDIVAMLTQLVLTIGKTACLTGCYRHLFWAVSIAKKSYSCPTPTFRKYFIKTTSTGK